METAIVAPYKKTPEGREAETILRSCVHCGFCTATCPTYQLLGDELDGPRGRIYLIKQVLEGQPVSRVTQRHLDRCLTCTACETTCPSGVRYHHLLNIGREIVENEVERPLRERLQRYGLSRVLPYPRRIALLVRLGQFLRPLLPKSLQQRIPKRQTPAQRPSVQHQRKVLLLEGCAQSVITPATNAALTRVLDRLGITAVDRSGVQCCGAVSFHLSAKEEGINFMRRNIDIWWPQIEAGVEAILASASGCGAMIKDYGHLLRNDPDYAEKAKKVSALFKDPSELLATSDLQNLKINGSGYKVAFHAPCTLQHTLQLAGVVESILKQLGFELAPVADAHLCCGSAGTYSILQPDLSQQLLANKLSNLSVGGAEVIATANIGCQLHLQTKADVPVKHWLELLDHGFESKG